MSVKSVYFLLIVVLLQQAAKAQTIDKTLISADKKFISLAYADAAVLYEKYLAKNPKDFYASRQAAISYDKNNDHNKAIDHWTAVVDDSKATDKDRLEYARCLLANYRTDDAKRIFNDLSRSSDALVVSWSKAYLNMNAFYEDSALCKIFPLTGIGTDKPEFCPYLYKGNELIYVTEPSKNKPIRIFSAWSNEKFFAVYSAIRKDSVSFNKGKVFNKHIQGNFMNGPVTFRPDDSVMYFTRSAPKKEMKNAKSSVLRLHIFYTEVNTYGFAHPELKPFTYNSARYDCMHPSLDATGKKMYFASDMPGTLGGKDIWFTEWQSGAWTKPVNLGPQINTPGNEVFPFITSDGILYFASDGKPGLGGLDIFYADPTGDEKLFREAENAGAPINTQFDDFGVYVQKDNKRGYLSSNRKNSLRDDDIYYFLNNKTKSFPVKIRFVDSVSQAPVAADFTLTAASGTTEQKVDSGSFYTTRLKAGKDIRINVSSKNYLPRVFAKNILTEDSIVTVPLKLKSQRCIEGKIFDKDSNQPMAGVKVAIYDEDGNKYLEYITDSTGAYKVCSLPPNKDLYIGSEKKPDYFTNTEKFRIKPDSSLIKNIYTQKIVIGKAIKVENIYFDQGKFNVRPDAALELDKLVRLMKDNPQIIIELSSHSDCIGAAAQNLTLSDKRAKSSAAYIVSKGIAKTRIKGKGYGESMLVNDCKCEGKVVSTCTEEQHAANRRVEIKVTGFVKEAPAKAPAAAPKKKKGK